MESFRTLKPILFESLDLNIKWPYLSILGPYLFQILRLFWSSNSHYLRSILFTVYHYCLQFITLFDNFRALITSGLESFRVLKISSFEGFSGIFSNVLFTNVVLLNDGLQSCDINHPTPDQIDFLSLYCFTLYQTDKGLNK